MRYPILLVLLAWAHSLWAQQPIEIKKKDFRRAELGFDQAWAAIKDASFFYQEGTKLGAESALEQYLKAEKYNPDHAPLNYNIGQAYLFLRRYSDAVVYLKKAFDQNSWLTPDLQFQIARAQHMNAQFTDAIKSYEAFRSSTAPELIEELQVDIDRYVRECQNGIQLYKKPERAIVQNLGKNINSSFTEHSPVVSADNRVLFFTSRRPIDEDDRRDRDGGYFEDIYMAVQEKGTWKPAVPVGEPLNTDEHDATIGLSPDGQELYIYRSTRRGDIYRSKLSGKDWSEAEELEDIINTPDRESSACVSFDGKLLYFVSNHPHPGALGQSDLYVSQRAPNGQWGLPKNLGDAVNTPYAEEQVFAMPDGRTLYFSSQGHNTMGGFDIFVTTLDDKGRWSKPRNLGPPINTPGDDVFYSASASGKYAYYSSAAEGGFGESDIYKITYLSPALPMSMEGEDPLIASIAQPIRDTEQVQELEIKTIRLTILKGLVLDAISKKPIEANIEIVDNQKNEIVFTSTSNSATGNYLVSLPSGKNYGIVVHQEGFLFHSENFDIPPAQDYTEIDKNIELLNIKVGSKVILKNIFFEFAKTSLQATSQPELDRIAEFMRRYPNTRIKINGHTDNVGDAAGNLALSKARAEAVVTALVQKGVAATRLRAEGFGWQQPVAPNTTEEGRQQNRRVEFEILQQ